RRGWSERLGEADRPGPRGGRAHRRPAGPDGAGARGHGTAGQGELVAARTAGPGAAEDLPARGRAPGRGPGPDQVRRVAPGGPPRASPPPPGAPARARPGEGARRPRPPAPAAPAATPPA